MKRSFSSKYEVYWKSIETEAVFTKKEINNEWNVHFLQNTRCIEKVLRLKPYLPSEIYRMNELLIFLNIPFVIQLVFLGRSASKTFNAW